jgi:hypothetical protein
VKSSYKLGNEPSGSIKMLGIYRVAAQLVASRVVLSSTELLITKQQVYHDTADWKGFESVVLI